MFEGDLATLSTADLLASAAEHDAEARRVEARRLEHAQVYADRFHPSVSPVRPGRRSWEGRERAVVLGGEGCPEIAEFAVAEFGVMLGVSAGVAARLIGESLALRHRFPFTWARVLSGDATPWKARQIAAECVKLSEVAARYVDKRVAGLVDSITPYRLGKIVRAARMHADPDLARAEADEKARERGVFVGRSDEHGTKTMYIKAAAGAVIRHDATIADIAEALKTFGDTRPVQHRRADAVGIIADARYTEELLTQARHHRLVTPTSATSSDHADGATTRPAHAPATNADRPADRATTPADHDPTTASSADRPASSGVDPATTTASSVDRPTTGTGAKDQSSTAPATGTDSGRYGDDDEGLLSDWTNDSAEPGQDDEADRDAPHPSTSDLPDPLDAPATAPFDPRDPGLDVDADDGESMDATARRALHASLAQIKHDAYANPSRGGRLRPGQTEIYVHLTDHTLATGTGVLRAEGLGPMLADQLSELIGYSPYTVKPVIDLNGAISVDAYEIPDRIRERVKLTHPVELFPFGTQETRPTMDLDHLRPYDPLGPPGQTSTTNLAPLGRFGHRVKTHAHGWSVRRVDYKTLEWTTPHGFRFHVDPTGTHRVPGRLNPG